ncbi:hypothetical protein F511_25999 [Dorcoceras hygrometricum]|uniref:Uncharacterized protein n=1 Tax=Dorcoceras hygrometricum TaxID=472368 RepID=A0A2Z7CBC7_9LAMI|nr:hypothetical protein F511_25999 [Dorcoceras hygrometricum]
MSLFDLQDVCIAIGSLATLDLPMVVDLIGIYGLKRTVLYANHDQLVLTGTIKLTYGRLPPLLKILAPPPRFAGICSGQLDEENPSALISSGLLVQADEGVSLPIVDLIDESTAAYCEEPAFLKFRLEPGTSCQQGGIRILHRCSPTVVSDPRLKSNKKGFFVDLGHRPPPCAAAPSPLACACATCALVAHGGRVLAVSLLHGFRLIGDGMRDMMGETRPAVASMVARLDAHWPRGWPLLRAACWASLGDDGWPDDAPLIGASSVVRRSCCGPAWPCAVRDFVVAAAAQRCSGDVVTADFF